MNSRVFLGLVVLVVGLIAGWYVLGGGKTAPTGTGEKPSEQVAPTSQVSPEATGTGLGDWGQPPVGGGGTEKGGVPAVIIGKAAVTYTDSGFSPKSLTVKVGTAVTFTNNSSAAMWVASAVHPTHQLLPGFDQLKSVGRGGIYEYTFAKVGTWKYHNHVAPADSGSVVVTQ